MEIGLLQCDHALPEHLAITGGDYDVMYTHMLKSAAAHLGLPSSIHVKPFAVVDGNFPQTPNVCEAWIVSSSRYDTSSQVNWITKLRGFICEIIEAEVPLVGICFGHQIIALALGGHVSRRAEWVAGVQQIYIAQNPWISDSRANLFGIHRDEVTELPSSARIIGSTNQVQIAAFLAPPHVFCIQYHVDFNAAYLAALLQSRKDKIGDNIHKQAIKSLHTETDELKISANILMFLYKNAGFQIL